MTEDHDYVRELVDRIAERMRRGENWEAEFEVEYGALTDDEKSDFLTLISQLIAHDREALEAVTENVAALEILFAYQQHAVGAMEAVQRMRGVLVRPGAAAD